MLFSFELVLRFGHTLDLWYSRLRALCWGLSRDFSLFATLFLLHKLLFERNGFEAALKMNERRARSKESNTSHRPFVRYSESTLHKIKMKEGRRGDGGSPPVNGGSPK